MPVPESACFVSTFQLVTLVATCFALSSLCLEPCVRDACRFAWFGWVCWTCRGAGRARAHELVLLGLTSSKSKIFHNIMFFALPILRPASYAIPGSVPFPSFPSRSSKRRRRHDSSSTVAESSHGVATVPISAVVATNNSIAPSLRKARIAYLHRFALGLPLGLLLFLLSLRQCPRLLVQPQGSLLLALPLGLLSYNLARLQEVQAAKTPSLGLLPRLLVQPHAIK